MDSSRIRELKAKAVNFFRKAKKQSMGIYVDSTGIYCTQVKLDENDSLHVSYAEKINLNLQNDYKISLQDGIEELLNSWQKAGIRFDEVVLCTEENKVYYYKKEFPAMDKKELAAAIHWDIASNNPLGENCLEDFCKTNEENNFLLGALHKNDIDFWTEIFKSVEIEIIKIVSDVDCNIKKLDNGKIVLNNISCIIPIDLADYFQSPKQYSSLYAAVSGFTNLGLEFYLEKRLMKNWQLMHLSGAIWCLSFIICAGSYAVSYGNLYNTRQSMAQAKQEQALLQDVLAAKERTDILEQQIAKRNNLLQQLNNDSQPVKSLLVHLGCTTSEGTWLTDVVSDEKGKIIIKGKSVSYNNLVKYTELLAEDKDFFTEGAALEKSSEGTDGNIDFQIKAGI